VRRRVIVERSDRLHQLAPDLGEQLDRLERRVGARGEDVVDLSRVRPLEELEEGLAEEVVRVSQKPEAAAPVPLAGALPLRRAVARWYSASERVTVDPETQVLVLPGAREALLQLALALLGPDDVACTLDPADTIHHSVTVMADCPSARLSLAPHNGFQPDFDALSAEAAERLKLCIMGYPHDPTAVLAHPDTFPSAVQMARRFNVILCHDARQCYAGLGERPPRSLLATPGALGVAVEVFEVPPPPVPSPWRLSVAVGNAEVLGCLSSAVRAIGTIPGAVIQLAAASALYREDQRRRACCKTLAERRDLLVQGLRRLGWPIAAPEATPFLWLAVPRGYSSTRFASLLLRRAGLRVVPGVQFGEGGEGYVRLCFAVASQQIEVGLSRLKQLFSERPRLSRQLRPRPGRRRRRGEG
jgi:aspartate/methionine/tyrosine aminotransferase